MSGGSYTCGTGTRLLCHAVVKCNCTDVCKLVKVVQIGVTLPTRSGRILSKGPIKQSLQIYYAIQACQHMHAANPTVGTQ